MKLHETPVNFSHKNNTWKESYEDPALPPIRSYSLCLREGLLGWMGSSSSAGLSFIWGNTGPMQGQKNI